MAKNLDSPIHSNSLSEKLSLTSLIFGVTSIGALIILYGGVYVIARIGLMTPSRIITGILLAAFLVSLFGGILSLILGILGLNSTKKKFSIAGIILSSIVLMVLLDYVLKVFL
jgi:mannose/fructose/N-acetylgalactosamine-specific phosphotransferase system component IID